MSRWRSALSLSLILNCVAQVRLVNCVCKEMRATSDSCYQSLDLVYSDVTVLANNLWQLDTNNSIVTRFTPVSEVKSLTVRKTFIGDMSAEIFTGYVGNSHLGNLNSLIINSYLVAINSTISDIKMNGIIIKRGSVLTLNNSQIDAVKENGIIVEGTLIMQNVTIADVQSSCICISKYSELYLENVTFDGNSQNIISETGNPYFSVQGSIESGIDSLHIKYLYLTSSSDSLKAEEESQTNTCQIDIGILNFLSSSNDPYTIWTTINTMGTKQLYANISKYDNKTIWKDDEKERFRRETPEEVKEPEEREFTVVDGVAYFAVSIFTLYSILGVYYLFRKPVRRLVTMCVCVCVRACIYTCIF